MGEKMYLVIRWTAGRPEIVSRPIPASEANEAYVLADDMRVRNPSEYFNVVVETVGPPVLSRKPSDQLELAGSEGDHRG